MQAVQGKMSRGGRGGRRKFVETNKKARMFLWEIRIAIRKRLWYNMNASLNRFINTT